jgi:multicomponent Na+:H+ antiporter subunit B
VVAFAFLYIIYGHDFLQSELLERDRDSTVAAGRAIVAEYRFAFALGLTLAAGSGVIDILFGLSFLSQIVVFIYNIPVYHKLEFPSVLVFDLGVYFVVVGALLTILAVIGSE